MNTARILGIVLLVLGALGLVYDRFTYTEERHTADLGPISVSVDEKRSVRVPPWAGVVAIVAGIGLLVIPARKTA